MNKSKIILAATGGVLAVVALAMAYLVWRAYAAKVAALEGDDEGREGLTAMMDNANRLSRKPVYPCNESVKAIVSNETLVADWKSEAIKLAARGDRPIRGITSAQFKADMVDEAKRLLGLPGSVAGKIAKPEFAFGPFREYIAEGKMPADARIAELQRQWDDVVLIVETLSQCGIAELVDIQFAKAPEEPQPDRNVRKPVKKVVKKTAADESATQPSLQRYVFTFTTRPLGFIKCLNALETCERFIVVEDFTFSRERDVLGEALGGGEKKDEAQATGRRRRRGAAVQQAEAEKEDAEKPKNGIITDPLMDAPFKVELKVVTYDFKTLQETAKEEEKK